MKKSQKWNGTSVSWAPDANLCQVRLFSSVDCPSQSRPKDQYHLTRMGSIPQPPPRFRGSHFVKPLKGEPSRIPQMKWKCPPKFDLSCKWLVATGEESNETETQKLRERRVLEAVYPRVSDIPSSPSASSNIEVYDHDDRNTPLVPITPIEDDPSYISPETPKATENHISTPGTKSNEKLPLGKVSGSEADISAAASVALAAILKITEHGNLIDTDLLIQIIKNPEMIEQFMNGHQAPPKSYPTPVSSSSLPLSKPKPDFSFLSKPFERVSDPVQKMVQYSTIALKQDPISVSVLKHTSTAVSSISIPKQAVSTVSSHMPDIGNILCQPVFKPASSISTPKQAVSTVSSHIPDIGNILRQPVFKPASSISTPKQAVSTISSHMPDIGNILRQPVFKPASSISTPKQAVSTISSHMPNIGNILRQPVFKPASSISTPKQAVSTVSSHMPDMGSILRQPVFKPASSISTPKQAVSTVSSHMPNIGNILGQPVLQTASSIYTPKQAVSTVSSQMPVTGNTFLQPSIVHKPGFPLVKDLNYFKNLIKEHGVTKDQENIPQNGNNHMVKKRQPNFQKTCMYFNSSKGCRNGTNCVYQHDMHKMQSGKTLEGESYAKRVKVGNEITGWT